MCRAVAGESGSEGRSEDYYMQRMLQWFALAKVALFVVGIAVLYVPIQAAVPIAEELAGKNTELTASFSISIAISLSSIAGVTVTLVRGRERSRELERLRAKCEVYEQREGVVI